MNSYRTIPIIVSTRKQGDNLRTALPKKCTHRKEPKHKCIGTHRKSDAHSTSVFNCTRGRWSSCRRTIYRVSQRLHPKSEFQPIRNNLCVFHSKRWIFGELAIFRDKSASKRIRSPNERPTPRLYTKSCCFLSLWRGNTEEDGNTNLEYPARRDARLMIRIEDRFDALKDFCKVGTLCK